MYQNERTKGIQLLRAIDWISAVVLVKEGKAIGSAFGYWAGFEVHLSVVVEGNRSF